MWVLGGSGRSGRAIAEELRAGGLEPVLVGRDGARLATAARGGPTVVVGSIAEMAAAIRRERPAVVVNTVGPFVRTAEPLVAAALAAGAHYLDLANDVDAATATLSRDTAAREAGRTVVTGAGFGVTATESVVVRLCRDEPAATAVRVDMVPSVELVEGPLGEAIAASVLEGFAQGGSPGRRYRDGRLVPTRFAGDPLRLRLPDGEQVTTVAMPFGELVAAQRASRAPDVVSATSEVPSSPLLGLIVPVIGAILRLGRVRRFAIRRVAGLRLTARPRPREHSWAHASVEWSDGRVREGWLRLGDAQAFTVSVAAEVARRLLAGDGRPGAFTPAALFGPGLAETCGGEYRDQERAGTGADSVGGATGTTRSSGAKQPPTSSYPPATRS
ncbi:saccharopine dehydrogenase NADP-binding domain-containing protein [Pseudonocardia xishanensis]|uniref:Saccharopine dehydrogenase NADP-binding domain-containing protein n=1 Tax=Pseudonocardia xishanensis TaxID=630995 RepID=A0ABP8S5A7_9PSEU